MTPITIIALTLAIAFLFAWIIDALGIEEKWDQFKLFILNPTVGALIIVCLQIPD